MIFILQNGLFFFKMMKLCKDICSARISSTSAEIIFLIESKLLALQNGRAYF